MDGFYGCKVLRPPSIAEACGMKRLFQSCLAERSSCTADTFGVRHYFRCQSLVYDAASPVPLVCELIAAHSVGALEALRPCADFNCLPRPYLLSQFRPNNCAQCRAFSEHASCRYTPAIRWSIIYTCAFFSLRLHYRLLFGRLVAKLAL